MFSPNWKRPPETMPSTCGWGLGGILEDAHLQALTSISGGLRELQGALFPFEKGSFLVGQRRLLCVPGLFWEVPEKFSQTSTSHCWAWWTVSPSLPKQEAMWGSLLKTPSSQGPHQAENLDFPPPAPISLLFLANWQKINERGTD